MHISNVVTDKVNDNSREDGQQTYLSVGSVISSGSNQSHFLVVQVYMLQSLNLLISVYQNNNRKFYAYSE